MKRQRRIGFLLVLFLLAIGVVPALITYTPSDLGADCWPHNETPQNIWGGLGASIAEPIFSGLGSGAWFVAFSLCVATGSALMGVPVTAPILRMTGWLIALTGVCVLCSIWSLQIPWASVGPAIGPGGFLGVTVHAMFLRSLTTQGVILVATGMVFSGIVVCTDLPLTLLRGMWLLLTGKRLGSTQLELETTASGANTLTPMAPNAVQDDFLPEAISGNTVDAIPVRSSMGTFGETVVSEVAETTPFVVSTSIVATSPSLTQPATSATSGGRTASEPRTTSGLRSFFGLRTSPGATSHETVTEPTAELEPTYELPSIELLTAARKVDFSRLEFENRQRAKLLEKTFADFGFHVRVVEIQVGPVIAMFEIELEPGLRLNRILNLGDDLAVKLRVPSVRLVAPIPGRNTVGIEVPNATREVVRLRDLMEQHEEIASGMDLPLFIGKDVAGEPLSIDLAKLPHLLIAGTTGTGKSVCLNAIIVSLLMTRSPDEVRMILIDPKMVELSGYQSIPHLMYPPVTDMHKAEAILGWAVEKMEERYQRLSRLKVRNIRAYNALGEAEIRRRLGRVSPEEREKYPVHMPYFVLVADEMADLMMTAPKEVESHIIRLAQKSRAVGIHLVLATQKPTVNIITGLIKSNMPARVCFKVFSLTDSRVILDQSGGEKLLGQGDMLYMGPSSGTLQRGQGTYLSDEEINRVIEAIAVDEPDYIPELEQLQSGDEKGAGVPSDRDERYEESVDFVVREGKASTSLLQRALGLGYGRAARIIDHMFEDGIVGPSSPTKGREVLISPLQWERMKQNQAGDAAVQDDDMTNDDSGMESDIATGDHWANGVTSTRNSGSTLRGGNSGANRYGSMGASRQSPMSPRSIDVDSRANTVVRPTTVSRTPNTSSPPTTSTTSRPLERRTPNRIVLGERTPDPLFDSSPSATLSRDVSQSSGTPRTSFGNTPTTLSTPRTLSGNASRIPTNTPSTESTREISDDFQWYEQVAGRLNGSQRFGASHEVPPPNTPPQRDPSKDDRLNALDSSNLENDDSADDEGYTADMEEGCADDYDGDTDERYEDDEDEDVDEDTNEGHEEDDVDDDYNKEDDVGEEDDVETTGDVLKPADDEERELWKQLETMWDPPDFPGKGSVQDVSRKPNQK